MEKQNALEALKSSGKKSGLEIWVLRTVKYHRRSFPSVFASSQQKPEQEYEVFTVSPAKHGIFFMDDLYIVLNTHLDTNQRDIHFWFGKAYKETPPPWIDKFEDLKLDWTATQHFEFQGYECGLFESYFHKIQPAIRYKRGRTPEPYAERIRGDTRFYKLELLDKAHYRVKEIPFNIALMTKEQCFILDTDYNTRAYLSDRTTASERNKSIIVANRIREQDHEGNGDIEVVDLTTFSNDHDKQTHVKIAKLLEEHEEPVPEVDYDQPDEDPASPQVKLSIVSLMSSDDIDIGYPPRFKYIPRPKKVEKQEKQNFFSRMKKRLSSCYRRMLGYEVKTAIEYEIPALEEKFMKQTMTKPFKRNLDSSKCYMLEGTKGQGVFLWVGKSCELASKIELTECLRLETRRCEQYQEDDEVIEPDTDAYTKKEDKNLFEKPKPQWTHVIKVVEGSEPIKFKKYFQDWN